MSPVALRAATPPAWADRVAAEFDAFLLDHASAERKASAMAVSFVVQYPDKYELHGPLIRLAREELLHYQQIMRLIRQRRLLWERDEKDPYVVNLLKHLSTDRALRLLDRLMAAAVIEARGVERFGLVAERLEDAELARFYRERVIDVGLCALESMLVDGAAAGVWRPVGHAAAVRAIAGPVYGHMMLAHALAVPGSEPEDPSQIAAEIADILLYGLNPR